MDEIQKQNIEEFLKALNSTMLEHTKLLKKAVYLYEDFSSQKLIEETTDNKQKMSLIKEILIKLTMSAQDLLSLADIEDKLK